MEDAMRYNHLIVGVIILVCLTSAGIYAEESPWPMFRHDLSHTGRSIYTGPADSTLSWTFYANKGIASSPAIGYDGTIYVGPSAYSCFYAINPDGDLKWCFRPGAGVFSSPAIGPDGTIYVGSLDRYFYAIEDSVTYGKSKWMTYLETGIFSSPAIGTDRTIYVGSLDFNVYALNWDGTIKWSHPTGWCVFSSPAIGPDGAVFVGSKDEHLYALEDSVTYGKLRWRCATGQFYDGHLVDSSPAIGPDGTIYVGTDPYGAAGHTPVPVDTVFFAINPDGSLKWSFPMNDGAESSPAIGPDGTIYVGSYDSVLYAIADSGSQGILKWKFRTGGSIDGSPAVDACGTIYVGSRDSTLYAINPDGTERWSFKTNGAIESSPAIGGNGILYFGSFDGNLYALGSGAPDVGVVSIDIPSQVQINLTYFPVVTVRNYRNTPQSFDLVCLIDTQDYYVYKDTVHVFDLPGGGMMQKVFSPWQVGPDSGVIYSVTTATLLPEDDNVINDTLSKGVISVAQVSYIHGDANGDGVINLGDVVYLISYLYKNGPPPVPILDAGDVNCDEKVDLGDLVYLISYLYRSGPVPSC
jgi:outer membrane protein assembly factor BamB